ncbi:MAG: hypothetical protein ACOYMF_03585 [Bacteroidales bacterium]
MNFFARRKVLKSTNFQDLIPVHLQKYRIDDDGLVTLVIPKFSNQKFARWFIPARKPTDITIKLEKYGSAAWLAMDGKRNMHEIFNLLVDQFGDDIQPVNERMSKYMSLLYNQKHVSFAQLA